MRLPPTGIGPAERRQQRPNPVVYHLEMTQVTLTMTIPTRTGRSIARLVVLRLVHKSMATMMTMLTLILPIPIQFPHPKLVCVARDNNNNRKNDSHPNPQPIRPPRGKFDWMTLRMTKRLLVLWPRIAMPRVPTPT